MHHAVHLRGHDDLLAAGEVGERSADDLLARPVRVDVRRVEEVDARLDRPTDERPALILRERPEVVASLGDSVAHATETDGRDVETGGTELPVLHPCHPTVTRRRGPGPDTS